MAPPLLPALLPLVLLFLLVFPSSASIHEYRSEVFTRKGNAFVFHGGSEGVYASQPSVSGHNRSDAGGRDGGSFIRFEQIAFRRPEEAAASSSSSDRSMVQAVIFEVEDRETIGGSPYGGQRAICCTSDLAKIGACSQGTLIYRPSLLNVDWPKVFTAEFKGTDAVTTLPPRTIPIPRTGMYTLYFIYCDPKLSGLMIEGKTSWRNQGGYLPGRMAPLMKFYGFMSLAFVMLGLFWFHQYSRFWADVLPLQHCITAVIAMGVSEMSLWYFEFSAFNGAGVRPVALTVWAVTFATIKRAFSRVTILVVSMGFGVVRPTLGGLTSKVIMLASTFFLASEVLGLVEHVGAVSDLSGKARLILVLPVALLDSFFILWIFTSLSRTLHKLQKKRSMAKLDIYQKFTNALAVAAAVSIGWLAYELYFKSTDVYNDKWQHAWIIPAFWQVLSFSVLCVICALWGPSQNSMRYAYEDMSEEFDREEMLSLVKSEFSHSRHVQNSSSDAQMPVSTIISAPLDTDTEEGKML